MTNFSHGREAEAAAAEYLTRKGYEILAQNWRIRFCEIDIVASRAKIISFVEVKYRQNNQTGSGLEYITTKKLQQMRYAAETWMKDNNAKSSFRLAAIEVSGKTYEVCKFIESIEE
jgi:putative endonuclease